MKFLHYEDDFLKDLSDSFAQFDPVRALFIQAPEYTDLSA